MGFVGSDRKRSRAPCGAWGQGPSSLASSLTSASSSRPRGAGGCRSRPSSQMLGSTHRRGCSAGSAHPAPAGPPPLWTCGLGSPGATVRPPPRSWRGRRQAGAARPGEVRPLGPRAAGPHSQSTHLLRSSGRSSTSSARGPVSLPREKLRFPGGVQSLETVGSLLWTVGPKPAPALESLSGQELRVRGHLRETPCSRENKNDVLILYKRATAKRIFCGDGKFLGASCLIRGPSTTWNTTLEIGLVGLMNRI